MTIYVLSWNHRFVENDVVVTDVTIMGAYDSREKADAARDYFSKEPGYEPYCDDNVDEWGGYTVETFGLNMANGEEIRG